MATENVFADGYSCYLNYLFNYVNKFNSLNGFFEQGYNICKNPNFITKSFLDNIDKFPLFPYIYNIISNENYVKIISIYNVSADNVESLEETLLSKPDIARLKLTYDIIPERNEDIIQYAYFQYAYLSNIQDIYNKDFNFRSFLFEQNYMNFFSNLYSDNFCSVGETTSSGMENSSIILLYPMRTFLFELMNNSCNILQKLLPYLVFLNISEPVGQRINKNTLSIDFLSFISTYKNNMANELIELVGKSLYGFNNIDSFLKLDLNSIVQTKLAELPTLFNTFLITQPEPIFILTGNYTDSLYSEVASDIISKIYNDYNIINDSDWSLSLKTKENTIFTSFMSIINEANIEPYLFVSYLYKFWYSKFVNVLPLCLKRYIEDIVKPDETNGLTLLEYITYINELISEKIDYDNLRTYMVDNITITPVNYLDFISTTCEVPRFACILYYIELIDNFFLTTAYTTFVEEFLQVFFEYLRDKGHVDYNFNWYDYHEVVDIYLKTFLRYKIISDTTGSRLFQTNTDNFTNAATKIITNTTGSSTYDISINFPTAEDTQSLFENIISGTSIENMHVFTENMFLSVITREVVYGAFAHFIT